MVPGRLKLVLNTTRGGKFTGKGPDFNSAAGGIGRIPIPPYSAVAEQKPNKNTFFVKSRAHASYRGKQLTEKLSFQEK